MLGCCEALTMPTLGQHQSTKSIRAPRCLVLQCPSGRAAMPSPSLGSAASKSALPSSSQLAPYVHRRSVICEAKRSKKSRATPEQEAVPDKTGKELEEALVGTDDAMVEDAAETTTRAPVAGEAVSDESADAVAMPAPRTMTVSMPAPSAAPTTATALEQKEGAALIGLVVAAAAGVGGLIVVGKRFLGAKLPEMQKAAERKKLDRQFTQRLDSFCSMIQAQPEVNLSAKHLGEQGCAYVVEALAFNNTCSSLDLGKNMVGTGGVLPLVEALKHNDTLRVLGLDTNAIDDDGIVPLAELLVKNLSIHKLDLSANRTTNVGAAALEEVLRRNTTLEELDLSSNEIGYEGAVALAKGLTDNSALKVLKLSDNYFTGMGALPLAQALRQNQSLRELRLKGCELGDDGITAICDALADRSAPLEVLDVGNNSMSEEGAARVAELLKKQELKQLNLYMNDFGNTGAEALAEALRGNSTLEALDIGGNNVGAKGIKQLAEVLSGNSTLQSLELSYNPIGPDGAAAVVRVIKYEMPGLQTLKLGWCKVGAEDGAKAVSDLLMYNTTLQVVDLRGNNLGDDGALQVSRGLRSHENSKLMDLDLGYNEIKDDGACALANALKNNPEVVPQDLRLNMNYIQKLGGMALTEAIDMVYEMAQREMVIHF